MTKHPAGTPTMILRLVAAAQIMLGVTMLDRPSMGMDRNDEIGPVGSDGVPSAWDFETVNPLNGNLHLTIPLYQISTGAGFGMSLALHYDSSVWNAYDANWPAKPANRTLLNNTSRPALGWRMNLPRIVAMYRSEGAPPLTTYFFQGPDTALHRLHRKNCNSETEWYSHDGSELRAVRSPSGWTVWAADGTKYVLDHYLWPDDMFYIKGKNDSWYATIIESAVRKNDQATSPMHKITIEWGEPYVVGGQEFARRCPVSMTDDLGRTIGLAPLLRTRG